MAPRKRPTKKSTGASSAKKPTLKQLQEDPIWSTQDHRSNLVHENLHAKFADPKTYENWTKEDWDEARETCLPEDAPVNEDGYSVPIRYFKYDIDWRRAVREFQEDLGEGRYEPEWQDQAHRAMEERARGDFDKFKEQEFEEFWGQKQRTPWTDLAGEAAQIKLQELAEKRYIREGDIFSYVRLIKSGNDKILVEKDARVAKIEAGAMTMAIPPGRLKFARHLPTPQITPMKGVRDPSTQEMGSVECNPGHTNSAGSQSNGDSTTQPNPDTSVAQKSASTPYSALDAVKKAGSDPVSFNEALHGTGSEEVIKGDGEASKHTDPADSSAEIPQDATNQTEKEDDVPTARLDGLTTAENGRPGSADAPGDTLGGSAQDTRLDPSTSVNLPPTQKSSGTPEHQTSPSADTQGQSKDIHSITDNQPTTPSHPLEDVILHTTTSLTDLERRFVEIDGRLDPKDHRCANPWKMMRGKRNEQDLGTLFEMREEYYVWKSNRTVKMPKEQVEAVKGKGKGKAAGTGGVKSAQQKGAETKARKKAEAAAAAAAAEGGTTPAKKAQTTPKKKIEVAGKMGAKRPSPDADDDDDDTDSDSEEVMGTPRMTKSGRQVKKRKL